ncbi:MAG: AAA family ATPase [Nitrospirota bacterium]
MAYTIAVAGKGGTGKTTLAGLTVRYLIEQRKKPVLAVDADPNNCLNEALGVPVHATVGKLREDSLRIIRNGSERPGSMSMEQLFDYRIQQSIIESKGFDLLVMGRPEGPGCYCAANNIIRKYTDKLSETYPYVVIDNEAGMEHLSRRTTHRVNLLMIASDPGMRGLETAKRINALVSELELDIENRVLLINRISLPEEFSLQKTAACLGLRVGGIVPHDDALFQIGLKGESVFHLPDDAKALRSLFSILDALNIPS